MKIIPSVTLVDKIKGEDVSHPPGKEVDWKNAKEAQSFIDRGFAVKAPSKRGGITLAQAEAMAEAAAQAEAEAEAKAKAEAEAES